MNTILRRVAMLLIIVVAGGSARPLLAAHSHADPASLPTEELKRLNKAIKAAGMYMHDKTARLDSMTAAFRALPSADESARWQSAMNLAENYLPMRADSALKYSQVALEIARQRKDHRQELQSEVMRVNALSTCGIFTRALSEFLAINAATVPADLKVPYWMAARKLYGYMRLYVAGEQEFYQYYTDLYFQYDDSLLRILPESDPNRKFYLAERLVSQGNTKDARRLLDDLTRTLPQEANLYGMANFQLALVAKSENQPRIYASYLAKAAISDIKGCVKDGLALPTLAEWLYREGELNLAFQYINYALEDAMEGNVRMRTVTIASMLPVIDEAYREKINASRDELMVYFLLVTFLLILSGGLVFVLMRLNKRARANARKIARTSELQESYIGHFIGLCSTYANRLHSLQKLVVRKLASGQADELQKLIKSGKFGEDQNEEFYKIFDNAFLDIYPDFIEHMNTLLRPEEALELKKERELSPELRIYAFVRLGVDESTRIAQMLNYSVSTVYAYRNRMRNRAKDRENFDRDVMQIGKNPTDHDE
ncbi:MAG: hypothetical protein K2I37_07740 [Muribaculaceae bacterium]|nr:hypothetical protein [Muribaculaceae bacterium]